MVTIAVQDKFVDVLSSLGDLQESVNAALQRYTIEQITTKINELRRRDEDYKTRYGLDYSSFVKRTSEDVDFVKKIELQINKTWEVDLADWEFCHKGIEDWTKDTARHFAEIIELAQTVFSQVTYQIDATPERAILRMEAEHGKYHILVTELFSDGLRKYRYYVLGGYRVEAGFDNSPDPRAIRLKYGEIGQEHTGEYVPHLHLEDKTILSLTEEMTFKEFVNWLNQNLKTKK